MLVKGRHIPRPSLVRWDSSHPTEPFQVESRVMRGVILKVWRTDGYGGPILNSDYNLLTSTHFSLGKTHHIQNYHSFGYTRFDVRVDALAPIREVPDTFVMGDA